MKKISRRSFLKVSGAVAAAGAMAACGGSASSTTTAAPAASSAASSAAGGDDKFASLGSFTKTVGHAQPEGNPALSPWKSLPRTWLLPPTAM